MAFIPVPGVAEAALQFSSPGGLMVNTLYFIGDVEWDPITLIGLGDDLVAWWNTNVRSLVGGEIALTGVRLTSLVSATAPSVVRVVSPPSFGTHLSAARLPGNVTMTVTFRTVSRGRGSRGRNYVIGLTEDQVSGDIVTNATRDAYVDAYEALLTAVTENGATHVVVSRYIDGAARPEGIAQPVITYDSDGIVDSQRRRLTGRGA